MRRGVKQLFRVVVTELPSVDSWTLPRRIYTVGTEKGPYQTGAPAKALKTRIENAGGKARIDVAELRWREVGTPPAPVALDPKLVDSALRDYVANLDYDIHKNLECGEEDGLDHYAEEVECFIKAYENAASQPEESE